MKSIFHGVEMKRDKKQLMAWVGDGFAMIDAKCVDLVELFNRIGLKTEYSCCGHRVSNFYIMFDQVVTDEKIAVFLSRVSVGKKHTPLVGRIVKWVRYVDGAMTSCWMYQTFDIGYRCAQVDFRTIAQQYDAEQE